jgi:FKBP-type peptidyl-prolyl cis-trans isomerase
MRSVFVIGFLAIALITIALVVRSGSFARKNPGAPINSAMRYAMEKPELTAEEADTIARRFPNAQKTESGLLYIVHTPGEGALPLKGQTVSVNYTGKFLDGRKFDASADHGGPFNFPVGRGGVIAGWDEAFLAMKKGEKRTLIVPHWLAYGEKGAGGGKIPPRATLVFEVELVDVR